MATTQISTYTVYAFLHYPLIFPFKCLGQSCQNCSDNQVVWTFPSHLNGWFLEFFYCWLLCCRYHGSPDQHQSLCWYSPAPHLCSGVECGVLHNSTASYDVIKYLRLNSKGKHLPQRSHWWLAGKGFVCFYHCDLLGHTCCHTQPFQALPVV